nr:hypothetical protein [Tanacetum cinerariifolium]
MVLCSILKSPLYSLPPTNLSKLLMILLFYGFAINQEFARYVYSKQRIIAVTELKIIEWHNYKHLDWITVRRDDDKLYKFKEGDFKRLRIQDIDNMLLLLVQGKLTNLTVEERFAFNVSLRMFTRSIGIQRRVEDLQLGVEGYQKKLNLTKPNTYQQGDEAQAENDEFLKTIDENMQKIIKEQVKEQVKVQVSKILPKIEQTVNEQLKAKVLTWSSNSSKTSYAIAADLSEMELKKILIEKMEGNKSIHRSNEQRNLYTALVEAYESDKIILDTYGNTVMLKRRRDDADKDEEPFAGPNRGSKRRREGKEPESASAPTEKVTRSAGNSTQGSKSRQMSASESGTTKEPMQTTFEMEEPSHAEFETGADDQPIVESS